MALKYQNKRMNSTSEKRPKLRRYAWVAASTALFGIVFAGIIPGIRNHVYAQGPLPTVAIDIKSRGQEIISHLNSVIQFYRSINQPIQTVGEPNDAVYRDQSVSQASSIATYAFQSAKAEAALIAKYTNKIQATSPTTDASGEQARLQAANDKTDKRIADLQAEAASLDKQIATAKPKALAALQAQRTQVRDAIDLSNAMKDALQKIISISNTDSATGLEADIARLEHSVPEIQSGSKTTGAEIASLDAARTSGVSSQGSVLFQLIGTRHTLDTLATENNDLHQQALTLRAPLTKILHNLLMRGQALSQQTSNNLAQAQAQTQTQAAPKGKHHSAAPAPKAAPAPVAAPTPALSATTAQVAAGDSLTSITTEFKALSSTTIPLSQEIIVLEQSRANIAAWQTAVDREYRSILHALLLRILVIAIALGIIVAAGEIWTRATNKYVRDVRRRRQLMLVRRAVVGFLSALVVVFGFVTQFNSLATFAGFITAGIAVGLQTILLSVAAYFFIIGRYGIRVGDRITISSVTGDVIDVGLVRFYMMELAGSGTTLNPTGRVVVFSNAVLFQASTPLYKQVPGAEYAWHELIVKLNDTADQQKMTDAILQRVEAIYEVYRSRIEEQHQFVQSWMQAPIDPPGIEARLQFNAGVFQLWVRFPVQISDAAETDEKLTESLLDLMHHDEAVKAGIASTPTIQASIRG